MKANEIAQALRELRDSRALIEQDRDVLNAAVHVVEELMDPSWDPESPMLWVQAQSGYLVELKPGRFQGPKRRSLYVSAENAAQAAREESKDGKLHPKVREAKLLVRLPRKRKDEMSND